MEGYGFGETFGCCPGFESFAEDGWESNFSVPEFAVRSPAPDSVDVLETDFQDRICYGSKLKGSQDSLLSSSR